MITRFETADGDAVQVEGAHIAELERRPDVTIQVGAGRFHPGLINAHDHLHRNHYPRLGSPPYQDAYEWGIDIHARFAEQISRARTLERSAALYFGAFKNIIAGVTTVVHHDAWEPLFDEQFPLRVARVRTLHSLGLESEPALAQAAAAHQQGALCIHLAEGTNDRAASEVAELKARGLLHCSLLAVHAVGVAEAGCVHLAQAGAGVVWCPTSNHFLFGTTAPQRLFQCGVDILLGSDSLLTGAGTLLDELSAARASKYLDDDALRASVGSVAAARLGLHQPSLEPGAPADLIVLRRPLLEARPADVALVLVAGRPVLADADIQGVPFHNGGKLAIGGVDKVMPLQLVHAACCALALTPECARILEGLES